MSSNTVIGLSIDTGDAAALAAFWSEALGRPVNDGATRDNAIIDATEVTKGPRLAFHRVPEGKTVKNRLHLDLITADFEAETERLEGLGAKALNTVSNGSRRWTTFADIEGNEFDLIAG
jgi:predicted enzyme related to lactoylglutathione lyase